MANKSNQLVKVETVEILPPEASLPERLPTTKAELLQFVRLHVAKVLAHREGISYGSSCFVSERLRFRAWQERQTGLGCSVEGKSAPS